MPKIMTNLYIPRLMYTQQTDEFSEVTIDAEEDELFFEDNCYVKVDTST